MFGAANKNESLLIPFGRKRKSPVSQKKEDLRTKMASNMVNISNNYMKVFPKSKAKSKMRRDHHSKGRKGVSGVKVMNVNKYVERSNLRAEIKDLENSLVCLTKRLAENRRNQKKIQEQSKRMESHKNRSLSGILSSGEETLDSDSSLIKEEMNQTEQNDQGKKNSVEQTNPKVSFLSQQTKSSLHRRQFINGRNKSNSNKMDERLERVRTFLNNLPKTERSSTLRKDGMDDKEDTSQKSNSTGNLQIKDEGVLKNLRLRKIRRNSFYRNRVLASRAPLLETIIEEPEKEEEEAKEYNIEYKNRDWN